MEIGLLKSQLRTSQLEVNHLVDSSSTKDRSDFAQILQAGRDASQNPDSIAAQDLVKQTGTVSGSEPVASDPLRQAFEDFVGQTFFSELIKSYRSTQQAPAYFNGGRAEKIFQGQLDQMLSEQISKRSADKIADPMYERFMADRPRG